GDGSTVLKLYYDRDTVTVTFIENGGTLTDSATKTFKYGQTFSVTDPTRTDYAFNGWYNGDSKYTASTVTETENFTLTAHWTADAVNYRVEHYIMGVDGNYPATTTQFNTESGIVDASLTLSTLKISSYEVADGIMYKEAKVGSDVKTSTAIVKNMTVKLYYERKSYILGWETDRGTITNPTDYTEAGMIYYGTAITAPTLTKTGYTYAWIVTPASMPAQDVTYTANWTANAYYVAFNANGGSGNMGNQTFTYGTAQALTANSFTNTGRNFAGWATTADGAKAYDNQQSVSDLTAENKATVTIYAKWTANSYDVTLNPDGGGIDDGNVENYTYGIGAILPTPTKTNYAFGGWYTNSTFDGNSVTAIGTTETGSKEFWAKWTPIEYSISYTLNSGIVSGTNLTKYTAETDDFMLINPTRVGYTFAGWTGNNGSTPQTEVTVAKGSTGDRSYTANWTSNNYTVTMTLNNGILNTNTIVLGGQNRTISTIDGIGTFEYHYGESAALPTLTKIGYTFGGWYSESDFSGNGVTLLSASDIGDKTFYAKWTPIEYSISYTLNSGNVSGNPTSYNVETDSFTLINPTRSMHYTFDGWSGTDLTGNSKTVTVEKGSTGNRSYTANWTPISFTITYNLNGGTNSPSNPASYTVETESFTLAAPTKAGHTFDGWYNISTKVTGIAKGSTGNLTLAAKWTVNNYNITWNVNGGNVLTGDYTTNAAYGTAITVPTNPTRDATVEYDYAFDGWYTAQTGGTKVTEFGTLTDNVTYYARWTQMKRSYIITWNPENNSPAQTTSLEYGAFILDNQPTVTKSTTEVGKEYTLDGWYTEADGGTNLSAESTVTGDATYYAHWTLGDKKFTVTFDSDGGSSVSTQTVIYGNRVEQPLNPTKNGYDFMGWYDSYTEWKWNFNNQPTRSITLTAKWGTIYNVSTYAELVSAATEGGVIYLTNNIVLEDKVEFGRDAVVHGQGYTVSGKEANTATTGTEGFYMYECNVTMDNLTISGVRGAIDYKNRYYGRYTLMLDNVTIKNCVKRYDEYNSGNGAAIITNASDCTVILRNCTLTNNEANHGGALFVSDVSLELTDCNLTGNKSSAGGAMYITNSTAAITGCTFSGNSAPFTTAGSGGDNINYWRTTITLSGCTVDGSTVNR
ncbi:MAG TPA: hypothetical protein DDZ65_09180, partial [Firmicutes bacterium]|nr:hypothetical protein [Bacillota bacterium]